MNIETVELDLSDLVKFFETGSKMVDAFRYSVSSEDTEKDFRTLRDYLERVSKALDKDISKIGNIRTECDLSGSDIEVLKNIVSSFDGRRRMTGIDPSKPAGDITNPDDIEGFGEL